MWVCLSLSFSLLTHLLPSLMNWKQLTTKLAFAVSSPNTFPGKNSPYPIHPSLPPCVCADDGINSHTVVFYHIPTSCGARKFIIRHTHTRRPNLFRPPTHHLQVAITGVADLRRFSCSFIHRSFVCWFQSNAGLTKVAQTSFRCTRPLSHQDPV